MTEWVVGRRLAPMYISDAEQPYRPHLLLWLDLTRDQIVSTQVLYPDDPLKVICSSLRDALETPMATMHRPKTIYVDNEQTAALLREEAPYLEIVVRKTPEIDRVLKLMAQTLPRKDQGASYLHGKIDPVCVAAFFEAAAQLFEMAPWTLLKEDLIMSLSIPNLNLHNACLALMGAQGESLGFLLFDSLGDYRRFTADEEGNPGIQFFSVYFEPGSQVPKPMRREISEHAWKVVSPQAYPRMLRLDADHLNTPTTDKDYALATLACLALVRFCTKHKPLLQDVDPIETRESFSLPIEDRNYQVEVILPHPEMNLVFRDIAETSAVLDDYTTEMHEEDMALDWVEAFIDGLIETGKAEDYYDVAQFACEHLVLWKLNEMDGQLHRWTPSIVQYYLLEYFPGMISGDKRALEAVPEILLEFFEFLSQEGKIDAQDATLVKQRLNKIRSDFLHATKPIEPANNLVQLRPKKT